MDHNNIIECGGFYFIYNFDSGNLGHVERVPTELIVPSITNQKGGPTEVPDYEFNLWTRPDCAGTEFENGNRTWFYFGIQASEPNVLVRLNLINLNKQGKMYTQGMAPVTRTLPGKPQWERIRDRPIHNTDDNTFTLSFKYRTSENTKATTFFAFTYPFSFAELQIALNSIDMKMLPLPPPQSPDDIYYCRECLVYSLERRRVDLLTISSYHGITNEREIRLKNLFPEKQDRPFKFQNKKVIFISARVHPGETPSSFVFNGFLNLLLNRNDPIAIQLRKNYVFKMIPFLNPDGVARGHYRTDTRGVNLNRVYLNPSLTLHPTIYASRALIRFHHYGCEKEDFCDDSRSYTSRSIQNISETSELTDSKKKKGMSSTFKGSDYYKKPADKAKGVKSSTTTLKQSSDTKRENSYKISGEAAILADQVLDMSIREIPSQVNESQLPKKAATPAPDKSHSLLNEQSLRNCLGSNVHLTSSEELVFQGAANPLRPLRDTLKNSISLLMGSSSTVGGSDSLQEQESRLSNVKMGWCRECRAKVSQLEDSMPGITGIVPGYNSFTGKEQEHTVIYTTIEEYREHQMKQIEDLQKDAELQEQSRSSELEEGVVYFCTNCFKKYVLSENNEEIPCETVSVASIAVSAGDSESIHADLQRPTRPDTTSTGDTLPRPPPVKEERHKVGKGGKKKPTKPAPPPVLPPVHKEPESGIYLYIDLHGHASKKGIFMYGNHFDDVESCVECMLLPRIMSLNNLHFHFSSCNFTERNMYLKDRRDGMSREGSGRVAVFKATGLVRSYTLECNYNTGRLVNVLPPTVREGSSPAQLSSTAPAPPKYTPHIYEEAKFSRPGCPGCAGYMGLEVFEDMCPFEVGRSLGASILDLTGQHPNSRIPCSEHRNLAAVRDWLRAHTKTMRPQLTMPRLRAKTPSITAVKTKGKTDERKENTFRGEARVSPPHQHPHAAPLGPLAQRSGGDIVNLSLRLRTVPPPLSAAAAAVRARYLSDGEPKPKSLAAKRRNALSIRKPNASKTQVGARVGVSKPRRDDSGVARSTLGKRSFARRKPAAVPHIHALASSSSEGIDTHWEEARESPSPSGAVPRRRPFPAPQPAHLKKIRLKAGM